MGYRKVTINDTQQRTLHSEFTNRKYLINIGLPLSYSEEKNRKWPAIYVLDGNLYFGMVVEIVRSMSWTSKTSDAVVVGISYDINTSGEDAFYRIMARRELDLTIVRDKEEEEFCSTWLGRNVRTGGAPDFFKFLEKELTPFVTENYRVNSKQSVLMGHSHGGIFALYSMLTRPNLFSTYLSVSPPTQISNEVIFELEEKYSQRRTTLPCNLILAIGELERPFALGGVSGMYRFADQIENRNYKWFNLDTFILPDEDHCSCIPIAFQRGLRKALATN